MIFKLPVIQKRCNNHISHLTDTFTMVWRSESDTYDTIVGDYIEHVTQIVSFVCHLKTLDKLTLLLDTELCQPPGSGVNACVALTDLLDGRRALSKHTQGTVDHFPVEPPGGAVVPKSNVLAISSQEVCGHLQMEEEGKMSERCCQEEAEGSGRGYPQSWAGLQTPSPSSAAPPWRERGG